MAGDNAILRVDKHRIRKPKDPDALSNLPNLMLRVRSGIVGVGLKLVWVLVDNVEFHGGWRIQIRFLV
jgi:hypothetical protein